MIQIKSTNDIKRAKELRDIPVELIEISESMLSIVQRVYGKNRKANPKSGGYVIILQDADSYEILNDIGFDINKISIRTDDTIKTHLGTVYCQCQITAGNKAPIWLLIPNDKLQSVSAEYNEGGN